jgi:hypothetical protein
MFIIAFENFINKEVPLESLPRRQHHHINVSGLGKTDPNHHFPSSNIPSGPYWPGIIQTKLTFIPGENISEFLG